MQARNFTAKAICSLAALAGVLVLASPAAAHSVYTVRWGDTLESIAVAHRTTPLELARANTLSMENLLLAGTHLHLPRASSSDSPPAGVTLDPWSVRIAIDHWAGVYGVDPRLARALSWMESGYQADVLSSAGAWGAMQVTPSAWAFVEDVLVGAPVPRTADGNVRVGIAYLDHLLHRFGGDEQLALGAYYQGAEAVRRYGLYPETCAYVNDVIALKARV